MQQLLVGLPVRYEGKSFLENLGDYKNFKMNRKLGNCVVRKVCVAKVMVPDNGKSGQ